MVRLKLYLLDWKINLGTKDEVLDIEQLYLEGLYTPEFVVESTPKPKKKKISKSMVVFDMIIVLCTYRYNRYCSKEKGSYM